MWAPVNPKPLVPHPLQQHRTVPPSANGGLLQQTRFGRRETLLRAGPVWESGLGHRSLGSGNACGPRGGHEEQKTPEPGFCLSCLVPPGSSSISRSNHGDTADPRTQPQKRKAAGQLPSLQRAGLGSAGPQHCTTPEAPFPRLQRAWCPLPLGHTATLPGSAHWPPSAPLAYSARAA